MSYVRWLLISALASCVLAACGDGEQRTPAVAKTPQPVTATGPASAQAEAIAKDLGPTLRRDTNGLTVVVQKNGTKTLALDGRFGNAVVARRNPDGTISTACVDDVDGAVRFLSNQAGPHPTAPEKQ